MATDATYHKLLAMKRERDQLRREVVLRVDFIHKQAEALRAYEAEREFTGGVKMKTRDAVLCATFGCELD